MSPTRRTTARHPSQVTVSEPESEPQGQPDLTVSTFVVKTSPSGTPPGGSISLKAGVKNDGDADCPGDDAALLPLDGCDDHDVRHVGGDGCGVGPCGFG